MRSLADGVARSYPGQLDLVGVSMGGMVAQHVCIRYPERVRSAVIASAGVEVDARSIAARAQAVLDDGMTGVITETLAQWFTSEALGQQPEHPGVHYTRDTLLALQAESFADGWAATTTHDARAALPSTRAQVTVISGSADIVTPAASCEELARLIPGASLVTIPGPHMLPLEQGAEFARVVRRHLAAVADSAPPE
jgi:3-oxoadipate enol-lactonase